MSQSFVMFGLILLGIPYIILGFTAYKHFLGKKSERMLAAGPWWALYGRYYDEEGRGICRKGQLCLLLSLPIIVLWFIGTG